MFSYTIRPIQSGDYQKGYLSVLNQLSPVDPDIGEDEFQEFLNYVVKHNYHVMVIENSQQKRIVGTGTLLIEQKLIHRMGRVGHIEDVVIDAEYSGQGLGKRLVEVLQMKAKELLCYKVILNCQRDKMGFYQKCGFREVGVEMRLDHSM